MNNTDTVTERYFCTNYAVSPTQATVRAIEKCIEIFGMPDLTVILHCAPEINYQRMYNRDPNDKDFYKLKTRENFYDSIKKCVEIFNLPVFFLDTSALTLEEVSHKLASLIRKIPATPKVAKKFPAGISDSGFILNPNREVILGVQENFQAKKIFIPRGVKTIGFGAFAATPVEEVILNDECEKIGCAAFSNCKNLRAVKLGKATAHICKNAFAGCATFKISGGNRNFAARDNVLFQGERLIRCNAADSFFEDEFSVEHAAWSFENNPFVKNISARRLKKIGSYAYKNSALQEISLSACAEIHDRAFWNCHDLRRLKFFSTQPPRVAQEIFFGVNNDIEILVPKESFDAYKSAFQNFKGMAKVMGC